MSSSNTPPSPIAVIVGAGSKHDKYGDAAGLPASVRWGLGGALSLCFAKKTPVVLMGRNRENLQPLVEEIERAGGRAVPIACDIGNDESVTAAFAEAKTVGHIDALVFNAAPPYPPGVTFANLPDPHDVDTDFLQQGFNIGVTGCLRCVKAVIAPMLSAGKGSILLTGATQSLRGGAKFASMSPIKFGLRSLGQSLFQAYAPKGVHVAHIIIDGVIDSSGTRAQFANSDLQMLDPAEIADAYMHLSEQPKSCWSYEIQLSPNTSSVGMRL